MPQPTATEPYIQMQAPDGRLYVIRVDRHHDHTTITVVSHMHTTLDRAFPGDAEADAYLAFLQAEVEAGSQTWLIEERAAVLTSASAALDTIDAELVDSLNADMDERAAQRAEQRAAEQAAVARILATTPDHRVERRNARTANAAVFRPTKGNVHARPLTPAMRSLAAQHRGGIVRLRAGTDWRLLRGIVARGHGTVHEADGYRITAVRLNARGMAVAEQQGQAAA